MQLRQSSRTLYLAFYSTRIVEYILTPITTAITRYGDGASNTVEENYSVFSLNRMH